jgi:hypothetical protein
MGKEMKIKSHPKKVIKYALIIMGLLAVAGISYSAYTYITQRQSSPEASSGANYSPSTKDQIQAGKDTKKQVIDNSEKDSGSSNVPENNSLHSQITTASVTDGILYIRNEIEGVYQTGSCSLTLIHSQQTIKKTAGVQPLAQSSTCKGFNIPVSSLSPGTWQIHVDITIDGKTGTATSQVII